MLSTPVQPGSRLSSQGDLVPLRAVADVELITAPASIVRYNNLRLVSINGGPAPYHSLGGALTALEPRTVAPRPQGGSFEWARTAFRQNTAAGHTRATLRLTAAFDYHPPLPPA